MNRYASSFRLGFARGWNQFWGMTQIKFNAVIAAFDALIYGAYYRTWTGAVLLGWFVFCMLSAADIALKLAKNGFARLSTYYRRKRRTT